MGEATAAEISRKRKEVPLGDKKVDELLREC